VSDIRFMCNILRALTENITFSHGGLAIGAYLSALGQDFATINKRRKLAILGQSDMTVLRFIRSVSFLAFPSSPSQRITPIG